MHLLIGAPPVTLAGPSFFYYSILRRHLRHSFHSSSAFRQNKTIDNQSFTSKAQQILTPVSRMLISAALL